MKKGPKYLPLQTATGTEQVRRPTIWNWGLLKGFIFGSLKATGLSLLGFGLMLAGVPAAPLLAVGLEIVGTLVFLHDSITGSMRGAEKMKQKYEMAERQSMQARQGSVAPSYSAPSYSEPPQQSASLDNGINYRTDHVERVQSRSSQHSRAPSP